DICDIAIAQCSLTLCQDCENTPICELAVKGSCPPPWS
uniref:Mating pheromone Er-22 n=2 Tax=Euplotes raikovi TaxID=5938 RepID=MER22_EUPRA|nr:RecName: Full=Mating pheromone Er-22; AltName: Full=Euplomone R22 [Euplotes raikovi]1HD6_A Chain A, PHEROMONE ER-22 [Euplotes raikovi]